MIIGLQRIIGIRLANGLLRQRIYFGAQEATIFQRGHAHGLLLPSQTRQQPR